MRRLAYIFLLFLISAPLHARPTHLDAEVSPPPLSAGSAPVVVTEDPLERRMLEIAGDLRCTVCQNQPVSESNADLAKDMRVLIREQLEAGRTRQEIMNYFVERYGDYVLLKPPYERTGTILWIAPPILLLLLAVSAVYFIRRNTHQPSPPPVPQLSPEDQARIRAARKKQD
jgi:cytochrome c-type biogenesis protein CcmH